MLEIVPSQVTTPRWDFATDVSRLDAHGFAAVSVWRPKLSDLGIEASARALDHAGLRVSSLQSCGGFTGGDGRSFAESVEDALEAVASAAAIGAGVLVLHAGCRGGHTRGHAQRLLTEGILAVAPAARRAGVMLALKPLHPTATGGLSFLTRLDEALELVERCHLPDVGLAVDLWHFAEAAEITPLRSRIVDRTVLLQVADRHGPPQAAGDRLAPGQGSLPLGRLVDAFVQAGYRGDVEIDPVGETVETLGYEATLGDVGRIASAWISTTPGGGSWRPEPAQGFPRRPHRPLVTGTGSRRSHASSHAVSPR